VRRHPDETAKLPRAQHPVRGSCGCRSGRSAVEFGEGDDFLRVGAVGELDFAGSVAEQTSFGVSASFTGVWSWREKGVEHWAKGVVLKTGKICYVRRIAFLK